MASFYHAMGYLASDKKKGWVECNMEEKDLITLTETTERSKSNTKQIKEIKDEIKELKEEQKSIYKIATSVEVIANNMQNVQNGLEEVKNGQEELGRKMDNQIVEVRNEQKSLDTKIDEVKNTQGKKYIRLKDKVIEKLTTGIIWGTVVLALAKIFGVDF